MSAENTPKPALESGRAIVKFINSGDVVTLYIIESNGGFAVPPREKEIQFSNITCPRLGRPATKTRDASLDEPYAWEAREFLRKKLIGKPVVYFVDNRNPGSQRNYGYIMLGAENVTHSLVSAGLARVREGNGKGEPRKEVVELNELQLHAQSEGLGMWDKNSSSDDHIRKIIPSKDAFSLYESLRKSKHDAIVEQVRTGTTLRVIIIPTYQTVTLQVGGALAPKINWTATGEEQPDPFAREAKFITERNLLNRDIEITFTGVDKQENFFGKVVDKCSRKSVSDALISQGLATYVEWSCPQEDREHLQAMQKDAQSKNLRIWAGRVPSSSNATKSTGNAAPSKIDITAVDANPPEEFNGTVREIKNGCELVIHDGTKKYLVCMSSITVPRMAVGDMKEDDPWAWEARELLRGRLIGKKVKCSRDYVRPSIPAKNISEKPFYTVMLDKLNVALLLLEKGYASVVSHRGDDLRSPNYEHFVLAENKLKSKSKGVHSKDKTSAPKLRINDLTGKKVDAKKTQSILPFLKRDHRLAAVVEYVYSASRVKLYVPKESCMINFVLAGVNAPSKRPGATPDAYADESIEFCKEHLHQRDVEIEIDTVDKGGNFIGQLYLKKINFGVTAVENGVAKVHEGRRTAAAADLQAAEEKAKSRKIGLWQDYDEEAEKAKLAQQMKDMEVRAVRDQKAVAICDVLSPSQIFVTLKEKVEAKDQLLALIEEYSASKVDVVPFIPSHGALCLAKFDGDGGYYRAKVVKYTKGSDLLTVKYIDFGNVGNVSLSEIRVIPRELSTQPPFAVACKLAYLKVPEGDEDWVEEAVALIKKSLYEVDVTATIEYKEGDVLCVIMRIIGKEPSLNSLVVRSGLARVIPTKDKNAAVHIQRLLADQEYARTRRLGIWQYGDVVDDDDEYI